MLVKILNFLFIILFSSTLWAESFDSVRYFYPGSHIVFSIDKSTWTEDGLFIDYPKSLSLFRQVRGKNPLILETNDTLHLRLSLDKKGYMYITSKPIYEKDSETVSVKRYRAYDASDILPIPKRGLYEIVVEIKQYKNGQVKERAVGKDEVYYELSNEQLCKLPKQL